MLTRALLAALVIAGAAGGAVEARPAAKPRLLAQAALMLPCVAAESRDDRIYIRNGCSRDVYWAACVYSAETRRTERYTGPAIAPMAAYDFAPADPPFTYHLISSFGPGDFTCE